jgi:colanic acid/amylovoran biosynthesis glycosyltransferase
MNYSEKFDILEIRDYYPSINNPSTSTWVYNQVLGLAEKGYHPFVISPTPINPLKKIFKNKFILYDSPNSVIEDYLGTKVIRPGYIKIPNNKLVSFTLRNLSKCIKDHGDIKSIKIIHAHFGQNGAASLALKEKLDVPLITSFYGYDSGRLGELYKPFYQELIKKGDLFLALSQDMKKDLIKLGFPENKIRIQHLGIDLTTFKPRNEKNERFTLLSVARLDPVKGVQFVIKALSVFFSKYPLEKQNIQYKILGGGLYEMTLKKLVSTMNLNDNVFFINNLIVSNSRELVLDEMQKCDVFCLCSYITDDGAKEGTPVVLMEAQASGKPCIASFHAGIPEVVIDGSTGILTHEKSVEEIVNAIEFMYFNEKSRFLFSINARKNIEKEFNQKVQIQELENIYNLEISKYRKYIK